MTLKGTPHLLLQMLEVLANLATPKDEVLGAVPTVLTPDGGSWSLLRNKSHLSPPKGPYFLQVSQFV